MEGNNQKANGKENIDRDIYLQTKPPIGSVSNLCLDTDLDTIKAVVAVRNPNSDSYTTYEYKIKKGFKPKLLEKREFDFGNRDHRFFSMESYIFGRTGNHPELYPPESLATIKGPFQGELELAIMECLN